jgi:hypothetical protein
MSNQVKMIVPSLSESQENWDTIEFDKATAPRSWLTMVIPGGTNPVNKSREKNPDLFTGIHKTRWLHEARYNPSGTGERASRARQAGACGIVVADNSDNAYLVSALGDCAAKKCVVQIAIVDNMEQLASSKGFAVEGIIAYYGIEDDCCFVHIKADAYCETTRPGLGAPGAAFTMGGNLIGKSYDYIEQAALGTARIKGIQTLLAATLTKIIIPA